MASITPGQLPSSLEEVISLILQLYSYKSGESSGSVSSIQEALQQLQRSPEGWQLAQNLQGNENELIRFFGALTFIVKLNTDARSLTEQDSQALLQSLVNWAILCADTKEGNLVTHKVCSALVAYFLQFSASWSRCVKHIMYCLCIGRAVPYSNIAEAPETAALVQNISDEKAVIICSFAAALVEEVGKMDSSSMKEHKFHEKVSANVEDIVPLIEKYITDSYSGDSTKGRLGAMNCYQAWVSYSHRVFITGAAVLEPLQKLTRYAIISLTDDSLYGTSVELLSEVLTSYSHFLRPEDFTLFHDLFSSPWAQARYQQLVGGDFDFDSIQFGMVMIAFGDAVVSDLAEKAGSDPQCQQVLSALVGLLGAEGFAISEDKIFVPALEFWSTYVETLVDKTYSAEGDTPTYFGAAQEPVIQAIQKCWRKIQFPSSQEFNSWDSVERAEFTDARRDVGDMLQQFYLIKGISFLDIFIHLTQQSIGTGNWAELEASLFCLSQFSDCIKDEEKQDDYLRMIFSPDLFSLFSSQEKAHVPMRAAYIFLTLISEYSDFFTRHTEHLPQALNIAFGSTRNVLLAKTASSAIVKLCSSSRSILTGELSAFIEQFTLLNSTNSSANDVNIQDGVMEGISCIIQAIDTDVGKIQPLDQLLKCIEADAERCQRLVAPSHLIYDLARGRSENYLLGLELGLTSLRCLKGMARGLEAPDDRVVDLEETSPKSTFWTSSSGADIQKRILAIMTKIFQTLAVVDSNIVEEICNIFRVGFREEQPGPFVFSSSIVAHFMLQANLRTPRIVLLITTASLAIKSHKSGTGIEQVTGTLLQWVTGILQTLGEPTNDPEVAQSGIEFLDRVITIFPSVLFSQDPMAVEFLFMFTLKAMTGTDPLPKQASCTFWTSFLTLAVEDLTLRDTITNAMQHLGPLLAQALAYNVSGGAARSELEHICGPIKASVKTQVRFKNWLETALLSEGSQGGATAKDKSIFVQKVISLRGARATTQAVRDFWLLCRGSNFAYAS